MFYIHKNHITNFTKKIKPEHLSAMMEEITDKNYELISIRSKAKMITDGSYCKPVQSRIVREFVAMFTARCCWQEELRRIIFNRIWQCEVTDDDCSNQYPYFLLLMLFSFSNMPELIARLAKFKSKNYFFTLKSFNKTAPTSKYAPATIYATDAQFLSLMTDLGYLCKVDNVYKVTSNPIIPDDNFSDFVTAIILTTQLEKYHDALKEVICGEKQEQTVQAV